MTPTTALLGSMHRGQGPPSELHEVNTLGHFSHWHSLRTQLLREHSSTRPATGYTITSGYIDILLYTFSESTHNNLQNGICSILR